jgi:integrase
MASVSKRVRDGKTTYLVRWRDGAAQRKKSFARKIDADRFRTHVEHSQNTGAYVDPAAGKVTFREYAEAWRTAQPHRPNTEHNTRVRLTRHVYPVIGNRPIASIRPSEIQALVSGLDLSPSSVRPVFNTLRGVFRAAVRDRKMGLNPADGVKLPEVPRKQVRPLTVDQVQALTTAVPPEYRALVVVGAGAGLRPGELFGLQLGDIDFLRKLIRVERQVQQTTGHGTYVGPLKTPRSYRTVPVGEVVITALSEHVRQWPAEGHLFTNRDGSVPLSNRWFAPAVWRPAVKAAGLPTGTGMHSLRHFYASALIRSGLSVRVVSERLGHASAAVTLGVYSHLWPDDEQRSRDAIDEIFGQGAPPVRPGIEAR